MDSCMSEWPARIGSQINEKAVAYLTRLGTGMKGCPNKEHTHTRELWLKDENLCIYLDITKFVQYQGSRLLTQFVKLIPGVGTIVHQTTVNVASPMTLIHIHQIPIDPGKRQKQNGITRQSVEGCRSSNNRG